MAFEDWEKNPDGTVKVFPLVAFDTFRSFGMLCGLRVHYAEAEADIDTGLAQPLPLIMTVGVARDLAVALLRVADAAERPPSGGSPQ